MFGESVLSQAETAAFKNYYSLVIIVMAGFLKVYLLKSDTPGVLWQHSILKACLNPKALKALLSKIAIAKFHVNQ